MSFKEMVAADNKGVFMNLSEFAESRTIVYDGRTYESVPSVLSGIKEKDRRQLSADHTQGLFLVTSVLHFDLSALDGVVPEKGMKIKVEDDGFLMGFYVGSSVIDMGMVRLELEAVSE